MTLTALKQSKLARIVYHSELLQQSLDDLTGRGTWAYVQVLGCVLWQVKRSATLHCTPLLSSCITTFLWCGNRYRSSKLELHFYEASIGTILVLLAKTFVSVKEQETLTERHGNIINQKYSLCSWRGCCEFEHYTPSLSAEVLQSSAPAFQIQLFHPIGEIEELVLNQQMAVFTFQFTKGTLAHTGEVIIET